MDNVTCIILKTQYYKLQVVKIKVKTALHMTSLYNGGDNTTLPHCAVVKINVFKAVWSSDTVVMGSGVDGNAT